MLSFDAIVIGTGQAGDTVAGLRSAAWTGDTIPLSISLLLLGLGWNFCFVGGSTLPSDHLRPAERGRTQGFNDLLVDRAQASLL
jgi:hypothetical protein